MRTGADLAGMKQVLTRLPAYGRLAWALWRDRRLAAGDRAVLLLAVAYSVSPVDLIPGFLPVAGQVDDLLVLLSGIRRALRHLPPAARNEHLRTVGVTLDDLDADHRRVQAAIAALAGRTARLGGRLALAGLRLGRRAALFGLRTGGRIARAGLRAVARAVPRGAAGGWRPRSSAHSPEHGGEDRVGHVRPAHPHHDHDPPARP